MDYALALEVLLVCCGAVGFAAYKIGLRVQRRRDIELFRDTTPYDYDPR